MTTATFISFTLLLATVVGGCGRSGSSGDDAYTKEITDWQKKRAVRLQDEKGWLTLFGLFWLKEGENTFGADSSNAFVFPAGKSPKFAGSFRLEKGVVRLQAKPEAGIRWNDSLVTSLVLASDEEGMSSPTELTMGPLSFIVIKRADRLAIRARDKDHPSRKDFAGLDFFSIDPRWRIEARFEPYFPPQIIEVATIINTIEKDSCPGAVFFEIDGKEYRLDAVIERGSEDQLYFMFNDATNGKETYGLGRQLYAPLPVKGKTVLDFNKSYNWPCMYTDFATCPIPPKQNRLAVRVEAGEKLYTGH